MPIDFTKLEGEDKAAFEALIAKAVETGVASLKAKNAELLDETKKEREKRKAIEDRLSEVGDLDVEKAKELLASFEANEDMRLIKEGKLDEVVQRRAAGALAAKDKEIGALTKKVTDAEKAGGVFGAKWRNERLTNTVHKLAAKAKVRAEAYDDLVARAGNAFEVDDDGEIVLKKGVNLLSKDAKPHTLDTWLESLPESAPHFFESSSGGGARKGDGSPGDGKAIKVDIRDPKAFGANLEALASGKAVPA